MKKTAVTSVPLASSLAERWSPRAFDEAHTLSREESLAILEAGRWAASSMNGQPWRFSLLHRGDELWAKIAEKGLSGFNKSWAPRASALLVVSVKTLTEDGKPDNSAHYDAGLSVASLCIQAEELGLRTHQMGGFVKDSVHKILGLADDLEVLVVVAIGKQAAAETLEGPAVDRELAPRTRLELDEIVLHGKP
jgi:nitroreductase